MQHTDYRIVRFQDQGVESFKILPISYDSDGNPVAVISDHTVMQHASVNDLLHAMTHMMAAFSKPVLQYALFDTTSRLDTAQAFSLLRNKNV